MKKRYNLSLNEIGLIEIADFFAAFWLVGILATFWPFGLVSFFSEWKWIFFVLAIVFGIIPLWRMLESKEKPEMKEVKKKKKVKKK